MGDFLCINSCKTWLFYNKSTKFLIFLIFYFATDWINSWLFHQKSAKLSFSLWLVAGSKAGFSKCTFYASKWLSLQKQQNSQFFSINCWNMNFLRRWYFFKEWYLKASYNFIENQQNLWLNIEIWTSPYHFMLPYTPMKNLKDLWFWAFNPLTGWATDLLFSL